MERVDEQIHWLLKRAVLGKAFSKVKHVPCLAQGGPDDADQKGPREKVICKGHLMG